MSLQQSCEKPHAWPSDAGAPPLFATPRDRAWLTDGPLIAVIAKALGKPLLPWQRHVLDVATEYRLTPEGTREYHYRTVVVSVPRQTGKTTLIHALGVYRAMILGHDFFYTAQTGKDSRARWADLVKGLRKSAALKGQIKVALRGGSEHVEFPNGHVFQSFAPTDEGLHGYTPPTVVLDEAFAHTAAKGAMLMGAISPAQQTVKAKQLIIVSTMGHADSTFLHDWVDRAMSGAASVAGFVWGAADHHDPFSLEDLPKFHPGVGFFLNDGILTASAVLAEAENNSRAEYERAFANRRTVTRGHLIPAEKWRTMAADELEPPDVSRCVLSYDVAADRQSATVMATWLDDVTPLTTAQQMPTSKVVRADAGTHWVADYVAELDREWRPASVVAVDNGPVLDVTARLQDAGVHVEPLKEREFATACGAWLSRVDHGTMRHDGSDALERSVTGLVVRAAVSDGIAFSRRHSVGDSSAAVAMVAGVWVAVRDGSSRGPVVRFSQ